MSYLNTLSYFEYKLLLSDPATFFKELVVSNYNGKGYGNLFGSTGSFWNDLEQNLLAKGLAPFNFISQGNYYVNNLWFNFFGFFGHIALFRVFQHIYPKQKLLVLLGCFCIPTMLFYASCIGKDNVVFTSMGMYCFALYFYSKAGFTLKRFAWLLLFFAVLLLMRNHIALLIIPPAAAFYYSSRRKLNPLPVFGAFITGILILLIVVPLLTPSINPASILSQKQADFLAIGQANSQIVTTPLEPTNAGLLKNMPEAINHGLLRPYLWEGQSMFTFLQGLELTIIILIVAGSFIQFIRSSGKQHIHSFVIVGIVFSVMVMLMNGYIVPNTHTLVRYRSLYLPFILIPALCGAFGKLGIKH
ncbi:MAG: hypothetical protein EOO06_16205 [Chitinophagaceae bacterium]|nr:MAG: hypothetical protein EOO06_16205 [Chitinophagaceae bacterium]